MHCVVNAIIFCLGRTRVTTEVRIARTFDHSTCNQPLGSPLLFRCVASFPGQTLPLSLNFCSRMREPWNEAIATAHAHIHIDGNSLKYALFVFELELFTGCTNWHFLSFFEMWSITGCH